MNVGPAMQFFLSQVREHITNKRFCRGLVPVNSGESRDARKRMTADLRLDASRERRYSVASVRSFWRAADPNQLSDEVYWHHDEGRSERNSRLRAGMAGR